MKLGYVGLGKMGKNMVLRLHEHEGAGPSGGGQFSIGRQHGRRMQKTKHPRRAGEDEARKHQYLGGPLPWSTIGWLLPRLLNALQLHRQPFQLIRLFVMGRVSNTLPQSVNGFP